MYIKEEISNTIIVEKSRFIAYLKPCFNEEDYKTFLKDIKKKHYDADHVCSGFVSDNIKRSSDDGEPSGTAGVPILNVLLKSNVNHTTALVVRYFGGIKLGAGGLIRTYGQVVSETLKLAKFVEDEEYNKYEITLSYDLANKLKRILEKEVLNLKEEYAEEVKFTFLSNNNNLNDKIAEITSGKKAKLIGKETIQKDI